MSKYVATVEWTLKEGDSFTENKYSRDHVWKFDGGLEVNASGAPQFIPAPYVSENFVDPEEAFVASLASCHMLFFLALSGKDKYVIESYSDEAFGIIGKNDAGKIAVTEVTLQPKVVFQGEAPSQEQLEKIHHAAHERCFIANSINSTIKIEPRT